MADPVKPSAKPATRLPVYVHLSAPIIIRGRAFTSLDVNSTNPAIAMEEEPRGIMVTSTSKRPGEPARRVFVPFSNIASVSYAD